MILAAILGIAFGFVGSMPIAGPIAALVVTRGIEGRLRAGAFIALGGAIVEALYAFLAFWGFSTYLTRFPLIVPISRGGAAAVLIGLGVTFVVTKQKQREVAVAPKDSAVGSLLLGATICAVNPALIATWAAVVTTLYSTELIDFTSAQAPPFALGVAIGIAGWFLTLLWIIRRYRERFKQSTLLALVRVIGVCLIGLGIWFAARFVQYFSGAS